MDATQIIKDINLLASSPEGPISIFRWKEEWIKETKAHFPFYQSFTSAREKCFSFDLNIQTVPLLEHHDLRDLRITLGNYYGGIFKQDGNHEHDSQTS